MSFTGYIFKDNSIISHKDMTRELAVKWINEAPNPEQRTLRKQKVYFLMYTSGGPIPPIKGDIES